MLKKNRELNNIAIVTNSENVYSETFIKAHIDNIPFVNHVLCGGRPPTFSVTTGHSFLHFKQPFFQRTFYKIQIASGLRSPEGLSKRLLKKYLVDNKIQLVLAEYGNTAAEILDVCKELDLPLVVHFHGYDAYDFNILEKYKNIYPPLFNYAAAIIVVSKDMQNQLIKLGAPKEKLHHITYGVNIEIFKEAEPWKSSSQVLSIGRFVDKKAPHLTILSFSEILKEVSKARLIMVGEGLLLESCKQLVKALKIEHAVTFAGMLPPKQVAGLIQSSKVFVQHSLTTTYGDSEGTPNSVLEAGCSGIPVVSTLHAGIKDVVIHGETGFLVEEGDYLGMSKFVLKLLEDDALVEKLGRNARKQISRSYSMTESIEKLNNVIHTCYNV